MLGLITLLVIAVLLGLFVNPASAIIFVILFGGYALFI